MKEIREDARGFDSVELPHSPSQGFNFEVCGSKGGREFIPRGLKSFYELSTLLDLCVSSLRRGHANILCAVPILMDDPRRESFLPM